MRCPQLARRLRAAQHQHGEQAHSAARQAERLPRACAGTSWSVRSTSSPDGSSAAARAARARARISRSRVSSTGSRLVRLVAGEAQRVERQGVGVRGGALLLDQAAEHPHLNRVGLHAPETSQTIRRAPDPAATTSPTPPTAIAHSTRSPRRRPRRPRRRAHVVLRRARTRPGRSAATTCPSVMHRGHEQPRRPPRAPGRTRPAATMRSGANRDRARQGQKAQDAAGSVPSRRARPARAGRRAPAAPELEQTRSRGRGMRSASPGAIRSERPGARSRGPRSAASKTRSPAGGRRRAAGRAVSPPPWKPRGRLGVPSARSTRRSRFVAVTSNGAGPQLRGHLARHDLAHALVVQAPPRDRRTRRCPRPAAEIERHPADEGQHRAGEGQHARWRTSVLRRAELRARRARPSAPRRPCTPSRTSTSRCRPSGSRPTATCAAQARTRTARRGR